LDCKSGFWGKKLRVNSGACSAGRGAFTQLKENWATRDGKSGPKSNLHVGIGKKCACGCVLPHLSI
jgi:hypothetical protein